MKDVKKTPELVKDKFKVVRFENGMFDYDTVFIEVNKNIVQIPVLKGLVRHKKDIIGRTILVPCELIGDADYLFNKAIEKIEFV